MSSYNSKVKEYLLDVKTEKSHFVAELSALFTSCGSIVLARGGIALELKCENKRLQERIVKMCRTLDEKTEFLLSVADGIAKHVIYRTTILPPVSERLMVMCGVAKFDSKSELNLVQGIPKEIVEDAKCNAYIRGAMLGGGYIQKPKTDKNSRGYTCEWSFEREVLARDFILLLEQLGTVPKLMERNTKYVVYLKNCEQICDILVIMGAKKAMFELREERAYRSVSNNANRQTNCISSNISKTVRANEKVLNAVCILEKLGKMNALDERLKNAANLIKENDSLTLDELASISPEPISKSGLRHRLAKLVELSEAKQEIL